MSFIYKINILIVLILQMLFINVLAQTTNSKETIEKSIDSYITYFSGDYPGAVISVIKDGDLVFNKAYGLSNVTDSVRMNTDLVFNLAGLSKTFTAYAVLSLVERNKLNLNDNISDIFKGFPEYGQKVKIKNLLNHTSGLNNFDAQNTKSNEDVLNYLMEQDSVIYEPGTKWQYSNSDYALLVKVIEKKSRKSYKKFLEKYVFKKFEMDNSFLTEDINKIENLSEAHFKINNQYKIDKELSLVYGEQGIYTNSIDYSKWVNVLFGADVKGNNIAKQIFELAKLNNGDIIPCTGLGCSIMVKNGIPYYWQGGSFGGYTNFVLHFPRTKTTILILTNRNDSYDLLRLSIQIAKLYDNQLLLRFG